MCEKQKRIEELELENASLYKTLSEISRNKTEERKLLAEAANFDSQKVWRPWQIVVVPVLLAFLSGGAVVYAAAISSIFK